MRFGLETVGDTSQPLEDSIYGSLYATGSDGGVPDTITVCLRVDSGEVTGNVKCAIYELDPENGAKALVAWTEERELTVNTNPVWYEFAIAGYNEKLAASTSYWLVAWSDSAIKMWTASTGTRLLKDLTYDDWPDPMTGEGVGTYKGSIYCDYSKVVMAGGMQVPAVIALDLI